MRSLNRSSPALAATMAFKLALQDISPSGMRPSSKSGERKRPRTSLGRWDILSKGQREGGEVKREDKDSMLWFVLC